MDRFNKHIWHALWILAGPIIVIFGLAFLRVRPYAHYFFDPKHNKGASPDAGDFSPHLQRYTDLAKLAITLSAAAIAFLINTLINQKPPVTEFAQKVTDNTPIIVGFFGSAIALLIAFLVTITYLYEDYCHSVDHTSYKPWKYATCTSLAWNGVLAFVFAFGWLAVNLFS